jgi:hypothetical protein
LLRRLEVYQAGDDLFALSCFAALGFFFDHSDSLF